MSEKDNSSGSVCSDDSIPAGEIPMVEISTRTSNVVPQFKQKTFKEELTGSENGTVTLVFNFLGIILALVVLPFGTVFTRLQ